MNIQVIKSDRAWSDQEREETFYSWAKLLKVNHEIFHQLTVLLKKDNKLNMFLKNPSILELKLQKLLEFNNTQAISNTCARKIKTVPELLKSSNRIGGSELIINTNRPVVFSCNNELYKNKQIKIDDVEFLKTNMHYLKMDQHGMNFSELANSGYLSNELILDLFMTNFSELLNKSVSADKYHDMLNYNLYNFEKLYENSWLASQYVGDFWQNTMENTVEKIFDFKNTDLDDVKDQLLKLENYYALSFNFLWTNAVYNDLQRYNLSMQDIKNPEKFAKLLERLKIKKASEKKQQENENAEMKSFYLKKKMEWIYEKKYKKQLDWSKLTEKTKKILEIEIERETSYQNLTLISSKSDYKKLLDKLNINETEINEKIKSKTWILDKNGVPVLCSHQAFIYESPENRENLQKLLNEFGEKENYLYHCINCGEFLYAEDNADAISFSEVNYFSGEQDELAKLIWSTTRTIMENEIKWKVPPKQKTKYEFVSQIQSTIYKLVDAVDKKLKSSKTMLPEEMKLNIYFYTGLYIFAMLIQLVMKNYKKIKFTSNKFKFEKPNLKELEDYVLNRITSFFNTTLQSLQEITSRAITDQDIKNFLRKTLQNINSSVDLWKIKEVKPISLLEYIILDPRFLALRTFWLYKKNLDKKTLIQSWMPINILKLEYSILETRGDPWYSNITTNIEQNLESWKTEITAFSEQTYKSYDILHSLQRKKLALDYIIKYSQNKLSDLSELPNLQEFTILEKNLNLGLKHINLSAWDLMASRGTDRQFPGFNIENLDHWKQLNLIYGVDKHRHKWTMENDKTTCKICNQNYSTRKDIRQELKYEYNIQNFYNFYSYNCPKNAMHEFVNSKCKYCNLTYEMIENMDTKYYEKWKSKESFQEFKLPERKIQENLHEFSCSDGLRNELVISLVNKSKTKYNKNQIKNILESLGKISNYEFKKIKSGYSPKVDSIAVYNMLHSHITENYYTIGQVLNIQNLINPPEKLKNINPGKLTFTDMNNDIKKKLKVSENYFQKIKKIEYENKFEFSYCWLLLLYLHVLNHSSELANLLIKKNIDYEKRFAKISDAKKAKARSKISSEINENGMNNMNENEINNMNENNMNEINDINDMNEDGEMEIGFNFDFDLQEMENTEPDF